MAHLILHDALTGTNVDLNDVDLEATTNRQVISEAVRGGILTAHAADEYKIIGKDNVAVLTEETLASLGYKDGDTITVVAKPNGAAFC